MKSTFLGIVICMAILMSCDPVHGLKLENKHNGKIDIIFYPELNQHLQDSLVPKALNYRGKLMYKVSLDSGKMIHFGTVVAHYIPEADDIDLDFLEIRFANDTIQLTGKRAILNSIQKVENLDWRFIVK